MRERFRAADYRFLAVCAALAAVAAWYSVHNFYRAFPEASIDFQVSRDGGAAIARNFVAQNGNSLDGYRTASSFTYDDDAKTFLERTAGLDRANFILGTRIRLWRWSYRWFVPKQTEEYRVDVTTRGDVAGFEHGLPEDAARPAADGPQARAIAEQFLSTRVHRDLSTLDFVEDSAVTLKNRTDRTYTWKERSFNLADATIRIEVEIAGNEVTAYREYLKVPEQWTRDYRRLRSKNELAQQADTAAMGLLMAGVCVVLVLRARRYDIRWRRAAIVGLIGMLLSFCASLNQMPLAEFEYPTTDSYSSFLVRQLLNALLGALAAGGFLFILAAAAEPLYREAYPGQVSLGNLFTFRGLRTKRFFLGAILGITLTAIFVAYQTGFYIAAYQYGAWSPADVPYNDLLNTRFPWAYVLFGGFFPAVFEEFLFRMAAIPLLRKVLKSGVAAVVLAAFIWGFGHSSYPQQPFYIRGVEVGIGGVALGLVMLRWGILPTLVWHYSVDAMYSAMLLLRSHSAYLRFSGAASAGVIVLPAALALVAYWRYGGFEPVTGLFNANETPPPPPVPEPAAVVPPPAATRHPLSARVRVAAAAIFVAGLLLLRIPTPGVGDHPRYQLTTEQVLAASDASLRLRGIDPTAFQHVVYPNTHWDGDDSVAGKYLLERRPVSDVARLFERYRPIQYWVTRYFKPLDAEQLLVAIHPETAKVLGYYHSLPEDRPGADIDEAGARAIASSFAAAMGTDTTGMELKEAKSEKKKARRDYNFEWAAPPGDPRNADDAVYRVEVEVDGDRPVMFRSHWKIPEEFERAREQSNFYSILATVLVMGIAAAGVVCCIFLVIIEVRAGHTPWRAIVISAVAGGIIGAVRAILSFNLSLKGYSTEMPFEIYRTSLYLGVLMSVLAGAFALAFAAAVITGSFPSSFDSFRASARRLVGFDAGVALAAGVGLGLIFQKAEALLQLRFHAQSLLGLASPDLIVMRAPVLAAIAQSFRTVFIGAAAIAVAATVFGKLSSRWRIPLLLVVACVFLPADVHTVREFAFNYALGLLAVTAAALFCFVFARENVLAYAVALWAYALRGPIVDLLSTGTPALQAQGWALVVIAIIGFVWVVFPALGRGAQTA